MMVSPTTDITVFPGIIAFQTLVRIRHTLLVSSLLKCESSACYTELGRDRSRCVGERNGALSPSQPASSTPSSQYATQRAANSLCTLPPPSLMVCFLSNHTREIRRDKALVAFLGHEGCRSLSLSLIALLTFLFLPFAQSRLSSFLSLLIFVSLHCCRCPDGLLRSSTSLDICHCGLGLDVVTPAWPTPAPSQRTSIHTLHALT